MPPYLLLALAVLEQARTAPLATSVQATEIATCSLADGRVAMATRTDGYRYTFGRPGRPEITIDADPKTKPAYRHTESFPRAGFTELRFSNGETSYAFFHYFNLGNYVRNYEGATELSGLLVFQHGRRIAQHACRSGSGPKDDASLASLPDDPVDLTSDIIDSAETLSRPHKR